MARGIGRWGAGKLVGVCCGIAVLAVAITLGLSALVLPRSTHVGEENATVFVSYEGHPECGAVREYVNPEDLEAGEVISGNPGPCESRNLLLQVLQVLVLIAAIGLLLWVVWSWLGARTEATKAPGPA